MNFSKLVKYRNSWMGIAMLWIILFHSGLSFDSKSYFLFKTFGYGGVDIFLFASGLGCYFSLDKNPDILDFLKRRIMRLVPIYIPFIILWIVWQDFSSNISVRAALGNLLFVQDLTGLGQSFNWYISALFIFYILAPYFKNIIDRSGNKGIILSLIVLLLISVVFWEAETYIITVTRIPIFFIGMFIGKLCKNKIHIDVKRMTACMISTMLIGWLLLGMAVIYLREYLWSYGLCWYPFILITPGFCLCISYLLYWIEKIHCLTWIKKALDTVGKNSFELYLIHILLVDITNMIIEKHELSDHANWIWLAFYVVLMIVCILFKKYVRIVSLIAKNVADSFSRKKPA